MILVRSAQLKFLRCYTAPRTRVSIKLSGWFAPVSMMSADADVSWTLERGGELPISPEPAGLPDKTIAACSPD